MPALEKRLPNVVVRNVTVPMIDCVGFFDDLTFEQYALVARESADLPESMSPRTIRALIVTVARRTRTISGG